MKITCISDLHGYLPNLKENCDLLCIAGDICPISNHNISYQCWWVNYRFLPWLENLKKQGKYIKCYWIAGNHDFIFEDKSKTQIYWRRFLNAAAFYLQDTTMCFCDEQLESLPTYRICGTPWQPQFCDWAFNLSEKRLAEKFNLIPEGVNILISHGPPYGILDETREGLLVGSKAMLSRINALPDLKLFICGHIHEGYGQIEINGVHYVNCSLMDVNYQPNNSPITIVIK